MQYGADSRRGGGERARDELRAFRALTFARGCGTEARSRNGRTALMLAALAGHSRMVQLLLQHKANASAADGHSSCFFQHFYAS